MSATTLGDPGAHFLDANPVLRYLLADHPQHFALSQTLIESDRPLRISLVTLAEIGYILTRLAGVPRSDAVEALVNLLNRENIETHEVDTEMAIEALELCRPSGKVNFGDAFLWVTARAAGSASVWTFDEQFPSAGIDVRRP